MAGFSSIGRSEKLAKEQAAANNGTNFKAIDMFPGDIKVYA